MEWQKIQAIIHDRYLQHSYLTSDILMTAALRFTVLPTYERANYVLMKNALIYFGSHN